MDWTKIKTEYVTTDISQEKLAKEHGVSFRQLAEHSRKEGWVSKRDEYRTNLAEKTQGKSTEKISNIESNIAARKAHCREMVWKQLEERLQNTEDGMEYRRLAQTFKDLVELEAVSETSGTTSALADTIQQAYEEAMNADS